jgi:hypothetical protein
MTTASELAYSDAMAIGDGIDRERLGDPADYAFPSPRPWRPVMTIDPVLRRLLAGFEVYRSGAVCSVRCAGCGKVRRFGRLTLEQLADVVLDHDCEDGT